MLADVAPRKPKNPFNDLADLVKSQMYGSKPTTVSTQKKIKDVGTLVKTVDTFATGGLGRAVVADSKAQARGANVPVNLATYGVTSLAAGAVGAVVARGASKAVSKVVASRVPKAMKAITPINSDKVIYHAGSDPLSKGPFVKDFRPVDRRSGLPNVHMGTETAAASRQGDRIGMDSEADIPLLRRSAIDRYEIVNPKVVSKRRFMDNAFIDEEYLADLNQYESSRYVQYFDDQPTPKNKVLKYVNEVEDRNQISYLVPKSRVESNDVVYRGSKEFANQFREGPYTSPELNRLRDIQTQISTNQSRIGAVGASAGVAIPKKKNIRGRR